jgi:SNF2 family DNA or RNA helicase
MTPIVQGGHVVCGGQVLTAHTIYGLVFGGQQWDGPTGLVTGADLAATGLSFSEYPCTPGLHLQAKAGADGPEITVGLMGKEGGVFSPVASPADYLIAGNRWVPLPNGTDSAISELLERIGMNLGLISIGQYLRLLRTPLDVEIWDEAASSLSSDQLSAHLSVSVPRGLQARLYPYQEKGYRWLDFMSRNGVGTILADEMGLGKTLQVIAVILAEAQRRPEPNLIVCPATLLENWRRECAKFAPALCVHIHAGRLRTGSSPELIYFNVVVCSYETMMGDVSLLRDVKWNLLVIDEAQAIKNPEAQRTVKIKSVPRRAAIAVTGTPVENTLRDIWSIADFVAPGQLGTLRDFERRFPDTVTHASHLEPLISAMMLRRRVRNVAQDLPERIDIPVPLEMDEYLARAYEEIRVDAARLNPQNAAFTAMVPLRMYCAHPWAAKKLLADSPFAASPKMTRLFGILEEVICSGEKALVFTSFQEVADLIARLIREQWAVFVAVIDGRVPVSERQGLVDALAAAAPSGVLVLNPKAAGVGLNITSANHVIHYNLEWNPAVEDQASARSYRRGQDRPVTVHRLFYVGTVEEVIDDRMRRKRDLSETAVLGTDGSSVEVEDLHRALTISPLRK